MSLVALLSFSLPALAFGSSQPQPEDARTQVQLAVNTELAADKADHSLWG